MSANARFPARSILLLALAVITMSAVPARPCAADTGTLKLKVMRCLTPQWISGARVDVDIERPGVGRVDGATGYTDNVGYVEFTLNSLQDKDEAKVTVTPSGETPDANHVYFWRSRQERSPGIWDLTATDFVCSDGWYDQTSDIIECMYH